MPDEPYTHQEEAQDQQLPQQQSSDSEIPPIKAPRLGGYTLTSTVYPPHPCERCVRAKKTCKGIAGTRCEYCKRLKQKCSNARFSRATKSQSSQRGSNPEASSSQQPKRKASSSRPSAPPSSPPRSNEEIDELDQTPEDSRRKRRRTSIDSFGPTNRKGRILRTIADLELSIIRLRSDTAKELDILQRSVDALSREVHAMDEE